jgi:hypothetical protein
MSTEQNHLVEFFTKFLKRHWSTKLDPGAYGHFIGIRQMTCVASSYLEAHIYGFACFDITSL